MLLDGCFFEGIDDIYGCLFIISICLFLYRILSGIGFINSVLFICFLGNLMIRRFFFFKMYLIVICLLLISRFLLLNLILVSRCFEIFSLVVYFLRVILFLV